MQLQVFGDQTQVYPLEPSPDPTRYYVHMDVERGQTYHLQGAVDGTAVSAVTTVPQEFSVTAPANDTVRVSDGTLSVFFFQVPYVFHSQGATGFGCVLRDVAGRTRTCTVGNGPTGDLSLEIRSGVQDLWLLAYDNDATNWLLRSTPITNIEGGFGGFGAALAVHRWVVLP